MNTEIEMKLWVPNVNIKRLRSLLLTSSLSEQPTRKISNQYYDTPEGLLHRLHCALRIRQLDEQWLQTLKTRGSNHQGIHQRQEWEWPLKTNTLDRRYLQRIEQEISDLEGFPWEQVTKWFLTDFSRHLWHLQTEKCFVEVALDLGQVLTQPCDKQAKSGECLSEIELELKHGEQDALWSLALKLSEQVPVIPSHLSKAERGYRLTNPEAWHRHAWSLLDAPCQTLDDLLWGLEVMRFVQLQAVMGINMATLESKCRAWLRRYPNDRLQNLVDICLDRGFQEADSVRVLGQKLLVESQRVCVNN